MHVAFADSDQLCMCYPAPPGDPGRQHVKALNVAAMLTNLRSAGAQCVIVNGVLDPGGLATELMPDADVTICRLRARGDEVERRFVGKHGHQDDTEELLREIREEVSLMDQSSFADACVDTSDVPAADVAALVRAACKEWPGFTGDLPGPAGQLASSGYPAVSGHVVLITGPTGVGKSTIGFRFYLSCLSAGLTAGYVDLGQLGFMQPADRSDPDNQRLKARNMAAIWRNYEAAGAGQLVAVGAIGDRADLQLYAEELAGADLTVVRLRADRTELRQRIMSRGAGGSWTEPGDRLTGQSSRFLAHVADRAARDAEARDRSETGDLVIDTTGRSPDESADLIADSVRWFASQPSPAA